MLPAKHRFNPRSHAKFWQQSKKIFSPLFTCFWQPIQEKNSIGVVVIPKKNAIKAVQRNLLKRRLLNSMLPFLKKNNYLSIAIVAKPGLIQKTFQEIDKELQSSLVKITKQQPNQPISKKKIEIIQDFSCGVIPFFVEPETQKVKYLLIHHNKGHWAFPKGHPEEQENHQQTALRELQEETQLKISQILSKTTFLEKYQFIKNNQKINKQVKFFLAEAENQQVIIQNDEIQGYGWFSFKKALQTITFPESKKLLTEANQYLQNQDKYLRS